MPIRKLIEERDCEGEKLKLNRSGSLRRAMSIQRKKFFLLPPRPRLSPAVVSARLFLARAFALRPALFIFAAL